MKIDTIVVATALLLAACSATSERAARPWTGTIESWGTLREALRDGRTEGRVALADVARDDLWGVGAVEGLRGEITIVDGEPWVTEGDPRRPVTRRGSAATERATVLFATEVREWRVVPITSGVDPSVLDEFLASQARQAGLDPSEPFPFVVEGGLRELHVHVVAGQCPIRARMMGTEAEAPPYELHAAEVDGRLVGFYAPESAGLMCHMGSSSHVHVVLERDGGLTGHVETVGLAPGAVLKLPLR